MKQVLVKQVSHLTQTVDINTYYNTQSHMIHTTKHNLTHKYIHISTG